MSSVRADVFDRAGTAPAVESYEAIFVGFAAKGIPEPDIYPSWNVRTYDSWFALGRNVKKGERGDRLSEAASFALKERMRSANIEHRTTEETKGGWVLTVLSAPTNHKVGNTPMHEPPVVALAFDVGTKWEIAYRLSSAQAATIGQELIDESKKLTAYATRLVQ